MAALLVTHHMIQNTAPRCLACLVFNPASTRSIYFLPWHPACNGSPISIASGASPKRFYEMAEAIGLASGLVALTAFTFKACVSLRSTIQSFQSHPKRVRDLLEELETLAVVLAPLQESAGGSIADQDTSDLELLLRQCGKACEDFPRRRLINVCSGPVAAARSFRDWAKIQYMRDDIDAFQAPVS